MKKKINKKEIYVLLGILGAIMIICINFLQMHYSSDTYVLYQLGYFKYPSEYFLKDWKINFYIILLFGWNFTFTNTSVYNCDGLFRNDIFSYINIYNF